MIDHIVYGVPDLGAGVDHLERLLGVRATPGGRHPGRGTHNALLGLGGSTYLEIIAVDPEQDRPEGGPSFALNRLDLPRLVGWAVTAPDIVDRVARARANGLDPGEIQPMSRRRPDGSVLEWRLTRHDADPDRLVLPFLIDWGVSPHPSQSAPAGLRLLHLRARHPDPDSIRSALAALGAQLPVDEGPEPALIAELGTPLGQVTLR